MATQDKRCSILPDFKIHEGNLDEFKGLCERLAMQTAGESKCLYFGIFFDGDQARFQEMYEDADGVLAHVENVGPTLGELLKIADLVRLEIHGPEQELAALRNPLAELRPQFFTLEYGAPRQTSEA